jgi:ATP-binding cassette subfamily F protein 3
VSKPCKVLSGGEKIRLAFARIFLNPPNLLILDEPTTHLDLQGRETLEKALREYAGTICLVSHDIAFVRNVATSILALTPRGTIRCDGDYDYYVEKYGDPSAQSTAMRDASALPGRKGSPRDRKAEKRASALERQAKSRRKRALEKALREAENLIAECEAERAALVEQLSAAGEPPSHTPARHETLNFAEINRRLKEIEDELLRHTAAWEEAGLALELL